MRKWFFHLFGFLFSFLFFFLAYGHCGEVQQGLCNSLLMRSGQGHLWSRKPTTNAKQNPQPQNHEVTFKKTTKSSSSLLLGFPHGNYSNSCLFFFFCWDFLYQWETSWSSGAWKYSSCSLDKRYHDQRKQNCFSAVPGVLYFFKRSRVKFFRCGDDGLSVPCWSMKIPRQISQTLRSHVMKNKF